MDYLAKKMINMIKSLLLYTGSILTIIMSCVLIYSAFVFTYYPKKMQNFCDSISEGDLISDVEKEVKNNNFKQYKNTQDRRLLIFDDKTMGKSTCTIYYKDNERVYKKSYMND